MNNSLLILCLIMVVLIFAPFVLFNISGKTKKSKTKLKEIMSKNNLIITQEETWGNSYIGLDQNQKKIVLLKFSDSEINEQLFDISKIKECAILEKRKQLISKDKKESVLEKLDLRILLRGGETVDFNFFDTNLNYKEDFELKRIQKWKSQIVELITKEKSTQKVA